MCMRMLDHFHHHDGVDINPFSLRRWEYLFLFRARLYACLFFDDLQGRLFIYIECYLLFPIPTLCFDIQLTSIYK